MHATAAGSSHWQIRSFACAQPLLSAPETSVQHPTSVPELRKGMPDPSLFKQKVRYVDEAFDAFSEALDRMADNAWQAYSAGRKAPRTVKAGPGMPIPNHLAVD